MPRSQRHPRQPLTIFSLSRPLGTFDFIVGLGFCCEKLWAQRIARRSVQIFLLPQHAVCQACDTVVYRIPNSGIKSSSDWPYLLTIALAIVDRFALPGFLATFLISNAVTLTVASKCDFSILLPSLYAARNSSGIFAHGTVNDFAQPYRY